ncbi:MAG: hypothetical protein U0640_07890 [Phycisphaerales bacterium]
MPAASDRNPNLKLNVPTLRIHKASGQWVSDLGGKTHYFGKDNQAAWEAFLPLLAQWRERNNRYDSVTVREAARHLATMIAADCGHPDLRQAYAPFRYFVEVHGARYLADLAVKDLEGFKADILAKKLAPKTVNHWMGAVKRLIRYGHYRGWRGPMETGFIRMVPLQAPPPKYLTTFEVAEWFRKADAYNENLGLWLRVMLATGARPSEIVRLVSAEGTWIESGVFCLNKGKTNKVVRQPRCLVLNAPTQALLSRTSPQWSWQCTLCQVCTRAFDSGPHRLRHTAAFLIHRLPGERVSREDTDIWLGHYPAYVSMVYNPIRWDNVKALADRYYSFLHATFPSVYLKE